MRYNMRFILALVVVILVLVLVGCNDNKKTDDRDKDDGVVQTEEEFLELAQSYIDKLYVMDSSFFNNGVNFDIPVQDAILSKTEVSTYYVGYYDSNRIYREGNLESFGRVWSTVKALLNQQTVVLENEYFEFDESNSHDDVKHAVKFEVRDDAVYFEYYQDFKTITPHLKPYVNQAFAALIYVEDGIVKMDTKSILHVRDRDNGLNRTSEQLTSTSTGYGHLTEDGIVYSSSTLEKYNETIQNFRFIDTVNNKMIRYKLSNDYNEYYMYDPSKDVYINKTYDNEDVLIGEEYEFRDGFETIFNLRVSGNSTASQNTYMYRYNIAYIDGWDECVMADRSYVQKINSRYNLDFRLNNQDISVDDEDLIDYTFQEYATLRMDILDSKLTKSYMELGWTDLSFTYVTYLELNDLMSITDEEYFMSIKEDYVEFDVVEQISFDVNSEYLYYLSN